MNSESVTIKMKATEQYFPVLSVYYAIQQVLTFDSVDEIPK